jgi:hypothetical protein
MTSGIDGPWQNQPALCWLYLALWQTKACEENNGLIRRRWGDARTTPSELEAAF